MKISLEISDPVDIWKCSQLVQSMHRSWFFKFEHDSPPEWDNSFVEFFSKVESPRHTTNSNSFSSNISKFIFSTFDFSRLVAWFVGRNDYFIGQLRTTKGTEVSWFTFKVPINIDLNYYLVNLQWQNQLKNLRKVLKKVKCLLTTKKRKIKFKNLLQFVSRE